MNFDCNRREFLGAGVAALANAACGSSSRRRDDPRPNVLFLVIDDLNDWVGCLGGHPDARTPHIDALAERGTLFTRAYCPSPVCNPSRVSTLTGLRPSTTGIYRNDQLWLPQLPSTKALPEYFMTQGYHVMGCGKIFHAGYPRRAIRGLPWSVARWWLEDRWGAWDDFYFTRPEPVPDVQPANGVPGTEFDWAALPVPIERMGDFQLARWVAARLEQRYDEPLFLACGFFRPHPPWYAPADFFEMHAPLDPATQRRSYPALPETHADDLDDVPRMAQELARAGGWHTAFASQTSLWRRAVTGYLASTSFVDRCVGEVMKALETSPHARNTVVVLWSDHGWHLGEKAHWGKRTLWEESTHVPLIVAAPGRPAGLRCGRTVGLTDLYPTLSELCGLPLPPGLEGESFAALLQDPNAEWSRPALTTHGPDNHSVRSEAWRYTRYSDGTEELYDAQKDPMEWQNLATDPQFTNVKAELAAWLPASSAAPV